MHIIVHLRSGVQRSNFKKPYHASEWLREIKIKSDGLVTVKIGQSDIHNFKNINNCISWLNLQKTE